MDKKSRYQSVQNKVIDDFARKVMETLEDQNKMLDRFDKKLSAPVLNGGFESLMSKVNAIENIQNQLKENHDRHGIKIDAIHSAIYDPDNGLYAKVKDVVVWIDRANWIIKGGLGLLATGVLTGIGKVLYDMLVGHVRYVP